VSTLYRFADLQRSALLSLLDAYQRATGAATSTVARQVAGDGSYFARLEQRKPNTRKTDVIVQKFADLWPAKAKWPREVPRPPVGKWDDLSDDNPT
jgi:hypothetical protein